MHPATCKLGVDRVHYLVTLAPRLHPATSLTPEADESFTRCSVIFGLLYSGCLALALLPLHVDDGAAGPAV